MIEDVGGHTLGLRSDSGGRSLRLREEFQVPLKATINVSQITLTETVMIYLTESYPLRLISLAQFLAVDLPKFVLDDAEAVVDLLDDLGEVVEI